MPIAEERLVVLTTYRRNGEPVSSPVWVVPVSDGRIGLWTALGTGKTERLLHDPRVLVQAADRGGAPRAGTTPVSGTAEMVRSGRLFDEVQGRVRRKYGPTTTVARRLGRFGLRGGRARARTYGDTVVLVRLDD